MSGFRKIWVRIAAKAGLPKESRRMCCGIHSPRSPPILVLELTIAAMIGHRKASVTSKYAHHADAVLLQAADAVAERVAELMGDAHAKGAVVPLRRKEA